MVGVWWEMHVGKSAGIIAAARLVRNKQRKVPHGANTANVKRYIDFAAKNGLMEYWWKDGIQAGKTGLAMERRCI